MKKIAFLVLWDEKWGRGILKKVLSQVRIWRDVGIDVALFMLTYQDQDVLNQMAPDVTFVTQKCRSMIDRFIQYPYLVQKVLAWQPDLVYHRYAGYYPSLARLAEQIPLVQEINTDDLYEYRLGPFYRDWYNRLTRKRLLSRAHAFCFVSHELSQSAHFTCFQKPGVVIGNGIDLTTCPTLPPSNNQNPHLVFIGSPGQPWHGVDKILTLSERYPLWHFDIIGINPEEIARIVPPNVRIHPLLDRIHYEPIFAQADVAIGTLALHRKKMEEASPLKVREYLAYGLPTIIAYNETDFPKLPPFLLQLPNTEDNIMTHLDVIQQFVERMRGQRVPREQIVHLDVRHKERQRLEFLRTILLGAP